MGNEKYTSEFDARKRVLAVYSGAVEMPDQSGAPSADYCIMRPATKEDWPENKWVQIGPYVREFPWEAAASKLFGGEYPIGITPMVVSERMCYPVQGYVTSEELDVRFNGPHILTDRYGRSARCCGDPNGCKWCADDWKHNGGLENTVPKGWPGGINTKYGGEK